MATKKITRRASPVGKAAKATAVSRRSTSTRSKTKRPVKAQATHVARVHHHWKKSHYQNVLHFSIAPKYEPIRGFSFLEGTLAIMIATFAFTILLGNTTLDTTQQMEDSAQTITVHQEHHSALYNFFTHNKQADVFTQG